MRFVKIMKITWKAKVGPDAMRTMILVGFRKSGFTPAIIARFKGRTGAQLLVPPQRFEEPHDVCVARVAGLYHELDRDWAIETELEVWPDDEKTFRRIVGRHGSAVLGNDMVDFLASTFPISVAKEVYRTRDGRETIRVLDMRAADGRKMFVIASKVAGIAETIAGGWLGTVAGSTAHELSRKYFYSGENKVGEWSHADLADEASFQAWLGPVILKWMPKVDYRRFVRGGDNSHAPNVEFWGDGFDHGGVGLAPPPAPAPNGMAPIVAVATPRSDAAPAGAPRPRKDEGPPAPRIDRFSEAERLRDDPEFGTF